MCAASYCVELLSFAPGVCVFGCMLPRTIMNYIHRVASVIDSGRRSLCRHLTSDTYSRQRIRYVLRQASLFFDPACGGHPVKSPRSCPSGMYSSRVKYGLNVRSYECSGCEFTYRVFRLRAGKLPARINRVHKCPQAGRLGLMLIVELLLNLHKDGKLGNQYPLNGRVHHGPGVLRCIERRERTLICGAAADCKVAADSQMCSRNGILRLQGHQFWFRMSNAAVCRADGAGDCFRYRCRAFCPAPLRCRNRNCPTWDKQQSIGMTNRAVV